MSTESERSWHREGQTLTSDQTLRLGKQFQQALVWARSSGFAEEIELVYHTLRLGDDLVGLGNFIEEFSHPECNEILNEWQTHPICSRLASLAQEFHTDSRLLKHYTPYLPENNVRHQFGKLRDRSFLLSMITNPLAATHDDSKYRWRRLLRLWLFIQAAKRVAAGKCYADKNISTVARHLIIRPSYDDQRWECIDHLRLSTTRKLGDSPPGFDLLTQTIGLSANQQVVYAQLKQDRTFLRALALVAEGVVDPIPAQGDGTGLPEPIALYRYGSVDLIDACAISVETHIDDNTSSDETPDLIHSEVDPGDSYAQQRLSANSVLLQSTELSHYLPWSWERLQPHELDKLHQWINLNLSSDDTAHRFAAAMAWMAVNFGRSLSRITAIEISDLPGLEWRIDQSLATLYRLSPQRKNPWRPKSKAVGWINEYANSYRCDLPPEIISALPSTTRDKSRYASLGSLWQELSNEPISLWFNRQMSGDLSRVTSSMLANTQPLSVFNQTADPNLARLLSSHPQSALPGACAYGSWDVDRVTHATQLSIHSEFAGDTNSAKTINIIGSRLDPLEKLLTETIQAASSQLAQLRDDNPIGFHNRYVGYCVMALYAATGCRPVRDPFECPSHFNWDKQLVYINDKSDGGLHNGRLVPLPHAVISLIQTHYLQHLSLLAEAMVQREPMLANAVAALSNQQAAKELPFFFLLDEKLRWRSVSTKSLAELDLFRWPLPPNLFRHRYSQQLSRAGIDIEIIDGWLGHAESGVASYGDFSVRCWLTDTTESRETINQLFERLGFSVVSTWKAAPHLHSLDQAAAPLGLSHTPFGIRARKKNRRNTVRHAINEVKKEIEIFLYGSNLEELAPEQLDILVKNMVVRDDGLPRAHAHLRYTYLANKIERIRQQHQIQLTLKRRFSPFQTENSLIEPAAALSLTTLHQAKSLADNTLRSLPPSRLSQPHALLFAAILLSLEKRISYQRLLNDVLHNQHCRLVKSQGYFYLEYAEDLEPDDYLAATQRHKISPKLAALLDFGFRRKKALNLTNQHCPPILSDLLVCLGFSDETVDEVHPTDLIEKLCRMVAQANLIELPGVLAATLSERVLSTSLSLHDWVRITTGKRILLPNEVETKTDNGAQIKRLISESLIKFRACPQALDREVLQLNAGRYFSEIKKEFKRYSKSHAKQCAKHVIAISKKWEGQVSSTCLLLGQWIAYRIVQGKHGGKKFLADSSIQQYFATLANSFEMLAYEHDILQMESDELTDLYAAMVDVKKLTGKSAHYFGKRLSDFHRWAATKGVATVYWEEIDLPEAGRSVSPGLLTETEYQDALQLIMNRLGLADKDFQLFLAFVLLICYRFGLRSAEATGLRRDDLCNTELGLVILVRNNRGRDLKSNASKRAVPLLFPLSELENKVIEWMLGRCDAVAGNNKNSPLLCAGSDAQLSVDVSLVAPTLIEILRHVTGNPQLVLHHCRHTFHNRIAPALFAISTPLAERTTAGGFDHAKVRHLILGQQNQTSRRSTMAAAGLMGHATPCTGMVSYNHLLSDWADSYTDQIKPTRAKLTTALNIAELNQQGSLRTDLLKQRLPEYHAVTPAVLLKAMRLASQGKSYQQACQLLWLNPTVAASIESTISLAAHHMWFSQKAHHCKRISGKEQPLEFLRRITEDSWNRLISHAEGLDEVSSNNADPMPNTGELPYMLGETRQLLMRRPPHYRLAKRVVDAFQIPATLYKVVARNNHLKPSTIAKEHGFHVVTAEQAGTRDKPLQLDHYRDKNEDEESYHRRYCALILTRNSSEIVRSSYDLAIVMLALGLAGSTDL